MPDFQLFLCVAYSLVFEILGQVTKMVIFEALHALFTHDLQINYVDCSHINMTLQELTQPIVQSLSDQLLYLHFKTQIKLLE